MCLCPLHPMFSMDALPVTPKSIAERSLYLYFFLILTFSHEIRENKHLLNLDLLPILVFPKKKLRHFIECPFF